MARLEELLEERNRKAFAVFDELLGQVHENFNAWLVDFIPSAVTQIKSVSNEAWYPKTPKRSTRKNQTSKKRPLKSVENSIVSNKNETKKNTSKKDDSHLLEPDANKTCGSHKSSDEERAAMPPPEPVRMRPKRARNQSQNNSTLSSESKKPRKAKASKTNSKSSRLKSEHLFLESVSTDDDQVPVAESSQTIPDTTPVPTSVNEEDNPVSAKAVLKECSVLIEKCVPDEAKSSLGTPGVASISETVAINEEHSKVDILNVPEKQHIAPATVTRKASFNRSSDIAIKNSETNSTPRLGVTNNVKRVLQNSILNSFKTTPSPKQLFSAYSKGGIKDKALAFENSAGRDSKCTTSNMKENIGTPTTTKKETRKSIHRKSQANDLLILARATRMSLSTRRSSLMRHRLSVASDNCIKRFSLGRNILPEAIPEPPVNMGATEEILSEETPNKATLLSTPDDAQRNEEVPVKDVTSYATSSPELEQSSATAVVSSSELAKTPLDSSPNASDIVQHTSAFKPTKKQVATVKVKPGKLSGKQYPASESKVNNKVAGLVSIFEKKPSIASNSCSKAQGFKKNSLSLLSTNVLGRFKTFQKPVYAEKSRQILIEKKIAKEDDACKKKQKLLKEKTEETKRRNDEKHQRAKENRLKELQSSEAIRRTIEKAQKSAEERKKSLLDAKKLLRLKRELELEKRRKEEEMRLRQKKMAEQKQQEIELKRQLEKEQEALAMAAKSKAPVNLNQTYTAEKPSESSSYDITPHRSELPKEQLKDSQNYDIDDLKSGDETDDEGDPRKVIPSWAQGVSLRVAVIRQFRNPPNIDIIFPPIQTCQLEKIFSGYRTRFKIRTSSACWTDTPLSH